MDVSPQASVAPCMPHLSLCLPAEAWQIISQHFVSIHASLTASFETSSLRSEAEWSRLGIPEQDWGEGECPSPRVGAMQFKPAEWASREDGVSGINASCSHLATMYAAPSICEALHQAQTTGDGQGSPSSVGLSPGCAHRVSRNPLCRPPAERDTNPPAAPTPALASPMGHLPEPPQGLRGFPRKIWQNIWTHRTRQAAHGEGDGRAALFLHWKPVSPEMGEPQRLTGTAESTLCESGDEED